MDMKTNIVGSQWLLLLVRGGMLGLVSFSLAGRVAAVPALPTIPGGIFNIITYGAVGDGVATNTAAIQNAIAAAGAASGGTVIVPAGTFLSGPLSLTNNLNLQINSGATLKMLPFGAYPGTTNFVSGTNLHDVQVSGPGTLDGQGAGWWAASATNSALARPALIALASCHRVLVEDVQLQNPPGIHLAFASQGGDITVQGITVNSPSNASDTTGIWLTGTNCLIQDCSISNPSDDNIQVVADSGVASDIIITNCSLGSGHGLSVGSFTQNGVSNLTVIKCSFNGTRNGIRLKSDRDRGGVVQNLGYYDLSMSNVRIPIVIHSYYNSYGANGITPAVAAANTAQPLTNTTPVWRDITISNLNATTASGYVAGIIWGRPEMPVSNVTIEKVNINASKTFDVYNAHGVEFSDARISLPYGNSTYTLFNAGIAVSSSPLAITFDGLITEQTRNLVALYDTVAALNNTNAIGNSPLLTLAGSTLTINSPLACLADSVMNFYLGTNSSLMAVNGSLELGGTLNLAAADSFAPGSYTLFTHTGSIAINDLIIGSRPAGYACTICTNTPGEVRLVVQPVTPPHFAGVTAVDGDLLFAGNGGPSNVAYVVLTATNLALPLADWEPLITNRFDGSGGFAFTNAINTMAPQRFYLLQIR
jgi:hypothetical protein